MAAASSSSGGSNNIRAHSEKEEAVEHLYDVTVLDRTILTTVTKCPEVVTEWIKGIRDEDDNDTTLRYIGVEAELYFDDDYNTHLGTFQMCDGKRCLIFQVVNCKKEDCPPNLRSFLGDQSYCFVGIDITSKMTKLAQLFSISPEVQLLDLGEVATGRYDRPELEYAGQSELVRATLGVNVEKPDVDHTEWGNPGKLSQVQVHYACLDAFLNLEVGRCLTTFKSS